MNKLKIAGQKVLILDKKDSGLDKHWDNIYDAEIVIVIGEPGSTIEIRKNKYGKTGVV